MQLFTQKKTLRERLIKAKTDKDKLGLVPTMGALHDGHLSLVDKALEDNDLVVVSIFINPTQFDKAEDLEKYPRSLDEDLEKLWQRDSNILVFAPHTEEMYDQEVYAKTFDFEGLEFEMEGKYRADHFNGVATIVKKLFESIMPNVAYFGEKDYQQLLIIKKLVTHCQFPIRIVGCPILRETNGLAMSSRNERLPTKTRKEASLIYKTLIEARKKFMTESVDAICKEITAQFKNHPLFLLEYVQIADAENLKPIVHKIPGRKYRIFIAVYAGDVRLIDNIALN